MYSVVRSSQPSSKAEGKRKLLYLLVGSASFFVILIWGILVHYDYVTHLVWESITAFFYLIAFALFSVLPKRRRSPALSLLGFALLGAAVVEWSHAIVYPGFYTKHPGLAVEYWIYARGLFVAGVFVATLINRNFFKRQLVNFFARVPYFPVMVAAFLIFASHFIPENVFYEGATTVWKSLLEIVFAGLLFFSAYLTRSEKPFALALLLAGLGEMSLVSYGVDVFTSQFVVGHAFLVASAVTIGIWAAKEYVFVPFSQLEEIAESHNVEIEELAQKVRQKERDLEIISATRGLLLRVHTIEEFVKTLNSLRVVLNAAPSEDLVIFHKDTLVYTSGKHLPDTPVAYSGWECVKMDDLVVYHNMSGDRLEVLLEILPNLCLKLEELFLKEKLQRLTDELKQTDEYRVNFMRSISHELKTPLNVVSGNIQLMEMGVFGDATHLNEPMEAIKTATRRAEELVNNLLDLSRAETGRLVVKSELVHFGILEPIIKQYKDLARQKGLDFNFDLVGQEPFSCDFKLLSTILSNLLSNAVKYTKKGEIRGKLEVTGDRITVEVSDTGKGIPEEKLERIFRPFQGEQTAASSGLGLAIVKRFVDLMNGVITVESEEGKGTKFHVELPRLQRPSSFEAKEHIQVLVVDVDAQTRELLKRTLKEYSLVEAATGAEAYLKALEHTPDLVVTSIGLPDVSGEELIKKLKEEPSLLNTRFVLYTGARIKNAETVVVEKGTDIEEVASKLTVVLGKEILLTYTERAKGYLSLVEKTLERFANREYSVKEVNEVTDDEVGFYDTFMLLVSEGEMEKAVVMMDRMSKGAHAKCLIAMILIHEGGKLKWHV